MKRQTIDMEEIKEIVECDADIETKYNMISNILTAKPHYFEKQETCEDCVSKKAVLGLFNKSDMCSWAMSLLKRKIEEMPPVKPVACIAEIKFSKEDMRELVNEKIKEITAGLEESKWIPVKERLPENTDYYLIQYSRKTCPDENAVAFYSVEEKESDPDYEWEFTPQCGEYKEVLAWMPLPEPYEGEKHEKNN